MHLMARASALRDFGLCAVCERPAAHALRGTPLHSACLSSLKRHIEAHRAIVKNRHELAKEYPER
jgi:hypothetical protein